MNTVFLAPHRAVAPLLVVALALGAQSPQARRTRSLVPTGAAPTTSVATRRVWNDPAEDGEAGSDLSPDGRLYAFCAVPDCRLAVRTLATGATRYLTQPNAVSGGSAYTPAFARDGKRIAFAWDDDTLPGYEVRVISLDGFGMRTIYRPMRDNSPTPMDWTPDDRFVLASEDLPDRTSRLILIPAAGGTPRALKSFLEWQSPSQARVAPDGKFVAYDYRPKKDDIGRDIFVLALDGSRESAVVTGPSDDHLVGWTPDGRLVFTSDRAGSPAVYVQTIAEGRARGEPTLIKKDLWRGTGLHMGANGTLFYSVQTGDRDVFSATFDPMSATLLSKPVALSQHPGEPHTVPDVSSDGQHIVYATGSAEIGRLVRQKYARFGATTITVGPLSAGESRTLRPKVAGLMSVAWGKDPGEIFMQARDDKGRFAMQRLDLKTGDLAVLDSASATNAISLPSPDGQWLYRAWSTRNKPRDQIWHLDAFHRPDGQRRELFVAPAPGLGPLHLNINFNLFRRPVLLSPDGRALVFAIANVDSQFSNQVLVVPTDGGSARELVSRREFPHQILAPAGFTPDGKFLLVMAMQTSGWPARGARELWRLPMSGGAPQKVEMPRNDFDVPALTPDGKHIVFSAGRVSLEYWVLEDPRLGFTPSRGTAQHSRQ